MTIAGKQQSIAFISPFLTCFLMALPLYATTPERFAQATLRAISPPEVYFSGTTPFSPLLTSYNKLDCLLDGTSEVIAYLTTMIEQADHEFLFQVYQWNDEDESAQKVLLAIRHRLEKELLQVKKRRAPLDIRIVINKSWPEIGVTSQSKLLALIQELKHIEGGAERIRLELSYYNGFAFGVLHSKTAIVDGFKAMVMTGNLQTRGGVDSDFYNMGVVLLGPAVDVLRDDWLNSRLQSAHYFSNSPFLSNPFLRDPAGSLAVNHLEDTAVLGNPLSSQVAVLSRKSNSIFFKRSLKNPQNEGFLAVLNNTQHKLQAISPALNVPAIAKALVAAVLRGVEIEIILSFHMDRFEQHYLYGGDNAFFAYQLYEQILSLADEKSADRLNIFWSSSDAISIADVDDPVNVHAKATCFDSGALMIGSMNWDWQSFNHSREVSVVFFGDHSDLWQERIYNKRRRQSVAIKASDLPSYRQHPKDKVYRYLSKK